MKYKLSKLLMTLVALFAMTTGAWAQYPVVYDFEAAANAGENPSNKNGTAATGQAFYGWENPGRTDSKRQDYKGYEWAEGSVLPEVCHVWRRSDRINGNVANNGGLKCPSDKEMAIDGLEPGLAVTIVYDATGANDGSKELVWVIGDGTADGGPGSPRATATINGVEAVPGETTIASGDVIVVNSVTPADNGTGYIVIKVMKGMVIKQITIDVAPAGPEVTWDATTKQATFEMPDYDVMLTPIYAEATIVNGQTETSYASLKEALEAVKDGDVIKLDWNATMTEGVETAKVGEGVKFTLDLNGYILDATAVEDPFIVLYNANDEMTIVDSSEGQNGGIKGFSTGNGKTIFTAGRYFFGSEVTAEALKSQWDNVYASQLGWQMGSGKEFVDIENAPDADGFMVRVAYKDFELAIGPQKFVTFYLDQNVKLDEATSGVTVYTVSGIDTDRSLAYVSPVSGVVAKETPILLYNATDNELTAKLTVTPDDATAVDVAPEFKGTAVDREFTEADMQAADYYALSGGKAFARVRSAGTLSANQCWLQFDKQQVPGARSINLVFEGGQTTGISVVSGSPADANAIYDLNGRRVTAPAKGVYIQNGKKVVK